jgi:hypothetical protein
MLRQGPDGFTVDFETIDPQRDLSADEQLLLKFRAALEGQTATATHILELDASEGKRLAETLERLESLQQWPPDVLELSRRLRPRLTAVE